MAVLNPRRGEVYWCGFDPTVGSEVQKQRPAIIISNDISNRTLSRVQVIPLTSNVANVYPSECLVTIKRQPAKAMADQIRTVSIARLGKRIATLTSFELAGVEQVIRLQLDL